MPRPKNNDAIANLGLGAQFRRAGSALRNGMDADEHTHVISRLILQKHISDAFERPRAAA